MSQRRFMCIVPILILASACGSAGDGNGPVGVLPPQQGVLGSGALSFDGLGDIASVTQVPSQHFDFAGGYTFEAWIRPQYIPSKLEPAQPFLGENGTHVLYQGAGTLRLVTWAPNANSVFTSTDTLVVQTGEWYHVAATYDGGLFRIYVNGVLEAATANMGLAATPVGLHLGSLPPFTDYYEGELDEVRVWNVARTEAEIQAGMGAAVAFDAPGLRCYYRCEGSGQLLVDSSQHGVHGHLGVSPLAADSFDPTRVAP